MMHVDVRETYLSYGSEASVEVERSSRLQLFQAPYEMLVSLVCSLNHVKFYGRMLWIVLNFFRALVSYLNV